MLKCLFACFQSFPAISANQQISMSTINRSAASENYVFNIHPFKCRYIQVIAALGYDQKKTTMNQNVENLKIHCTIVTLDPS